MMGGYACERERAMPFGRRTTKAHAAPPDTMAGAMAHIPPIVATLDPPKRSRRRSPRQPADPAAPQTPHGSRPWPRGRGDETVAVLGDLGIALARFISWFVVGLARLIFELFHQLARGLAWIASKISGGRMHERLAQGIGWVLVVGIVAGAGTQEHRVQPWIVAHWPRPHGVVAYVPPPSACTLPRAACAAPAETLDGQPSISATKILQVLQSYHSPAATADFAADLYDLGLKYGVNPAYALAFFAFESQCGTTGIAAVTLSLGNVRYNPSSSPVSYTEYQGFRQYATWRDGAEDWYWVIRTYYLNTGIRDIYDVTPIYAPASDHNDPQAYAQTVLGLVQQWAP
jgi:hypothetical protein